MIRWPPQRVTTKEEAAKLYPRRVKIMSEEKKEGQDVDILGTQAKALPFWEDRAVDLAKPELFKVAINPNVYLLARLNEDEKKRLFKKLRLVQNAARYMAAGMVKGTIKYAKDDYSLKQWFAHLIGEGADQMNYQMLLFQAWYSEQDKQEVEIAEVSQAELIEEQFHQPTVTGDKFEEEVEDEVKDDNGKGSQ